jgi:methyl-accepting chemotaxis protein
VAGSIADVNRGAADTGSAAERIDGLAVSLLAEGNHLNTEVEESLQRIRVA